MALYPHAEAGYWEYGTDGFPLVGGYDEDIIEDFESQSISVYGGNTSSFRVQGSNVLEGRYSLESTEEGRWIGNNGSARPTPRTSSPTEYRARILPVSSGGASIFTNVQSTDFPARNCYALLLDTSGNEIRLLVREADSTRYLERKTVSGGISAGTEYQPAITLTEEGINGKLYDRTGNLIAETDSYRDLTHSGGGLGWHNWAGLTTYFDYARTGPGQMGDVSRVVLNDFEDGNLNEYRVVGGASSGDQMVTPTASYKGNYGLEMVDFGFIQTTPGMGAENYIRAGHPIRFYSNFRQLGDEVYYFTFSMPDANEAAYYYELEFRMNGGLRIQKNTGGDDQNVTGTSSEGRSIAAAYDLSWSTDRWYRTDLLVGTDEIRADVYEPNGSRKAWVQTTDTSLVDSLNGFGHGCLGGGHCYFDEFVEITN